LVISGAGAHIRDLPAALAAPGLKVEVMDSAKSARKMPVSPALGEGQFSTVSLTALVGMGMDPSRLEFNLVPDSVRLRRGLMEKAKSLTSFGIFLMILLLSASLYATQKVYLKKQQLAGLTRECAELEPRAKKVEAMRDVVKAVWQRQDPKGDILALLAEVQKQTPKEDVLDTLDIDVREGKGLLEGIAGTRQDVKALVQNMEQSSLFKNAREEGATSQDAKTGRLRFKVSFMLEKDK
jgi:Tfp pilus assembly protein PilN